LTKSESDLEMIGRIYGEQIAATKQYWLAYHACLAAWRARHSDVSEQAAKEKVASLISALSGSGWSGPTLSGGKKNKGRPRWPRRA
jgi:hypothetical protein